MADKEEIPQQGLISARVTPWFYRRMVYMALIFIGFGGHFLYDGMRGYPKENDIHAKKAELTEARDAWETAKKESRLDEWKIKAKEEKTLLNEDGEPLTWEAHATENGWSTDPKFHSPEQIQEQFHFAWGCFVIGLIPVGLILGNLGRKVVGGDTSFTPAGSKTPVPFANIRRVDKRKWENKGLAYVGHSESEDAPSQVVKLDCLKFHTDTMEEIMRRILANFSGELIEKVVVEDDEEETGSEEI